MTEQSPARPLASLAHSPLRLLGACAAPILLTVVVIGVGIGAGLLSRDVGLPAAYGAYGLGLGATVAGLWWALDDAARRATFRFRWPSRGEAAVGLAAVPVGLAVFPAVEALAAALGLGGVGGLGYELTPALLAFMLVSTVVVGTAAEEVLYRGLLLGALLTRTGPLAAGALSIGVFALVHLPNFGVTGTLFVATLAVIPTALRLRYDNLAGAWLWHAGNNLVAYVFVPLAT